MISCSDHMSQPDICLPSILSGNLEEITFPSIMGELEDTDLEVRNPLMM